MRAVVGRAADRLGDRCCRRFPGRRGRRRRAVLPPPRCSTRRPTTPIGRRAPAARAARCADDQRTLPRGAPATRLDQEDRGPSEDGTRVCVAAVVQRRRRRQGARAGWRSAAGPARPDRGPG
ncbi:hypothetical protein QJS66_02100 [Kocuria rhizophila]|nr:hypothetical protein QJS66_02100 [Kocuria rhizophila]